MDVMVVLGMNLSDSRLQRVDIIGVPITATNMKQCLSLIRENIDALSGEYICVSNVHTTVMAYNNAAYYSIQRESVMAIPDGKPLSLIGKRTARHMDRVTGPDLMRAIFHISNLENYRHYFYGGTKEDVQKLVST